MEFLHDDFNIIISFYGASYITLLEGNLIIQGFNLKLNKIYEIRSPFHSLPLQFKTKSNFKILFSPFNKELFSNEEIKFYESIKPIENFEKIFDFCYISKKFSDISYPILSINELNDFIEKSLNSLIIIGKKGVGKSLFSRFTTNFLLNHYEKIAYLDLDIGQPENSLPGSLSLSIINEPIFTPPEFNKKLEQFIINYGDITFDNSKNYFLALFKLIDLIPKNIPLIINSLGFLNNKGIILHEDFLNLLNPNKIFYLKFNDDNEEIPFKNLNIIEIIKKPPLFSISPLNFRNLRFITYFTRNISNIYSQIPQIFLLNKIKFYINLRKYQKLYNTEFLTLTLGSIASIGFDESFEFKSNNLIILKNNPINFNLGWCLIRSIDLINNKIYLISPFKINKFNILNICSNLTPNELLFNNNLNIISYNSFEI